MLCKASIDRFDSLATRESRNKTIEMKALKLEQNFLNLGRTYILIYLRS